MSPHHQLLRATRLLVGGGLLGVKVNRARAAIRAAVELHAPITVYEGEPRPPICGHCTTLLMAFSAAGFVQPHPCPTVQAIARELGVEAGEGRG